MTESYHLSYTFILENRRQVYIISESGADHSLCLYRVVQFSDKWEKLSH